MIGFIWFAFVLGLEHALDIDHLVAMTNITVSKKSSFAATKDGLFWGIGHSLMIILFGVIIILLKVYVSNEFFHFFEVCVGIFLVVLGFIKLLKLFKKNTHYNGKKENNLLPFSLGIIHGLAGSGSVVLGIISLKSIDIFTSFICLIVFSIGTIISMVIFVYFFQFFSSIKLKYKKINSVMILISSLLCISVGTFIILKNV